MSMPLAVTPPVRNYDVAGALVPPNTGKD